MSGFRRFLVLLLVATLMVPAIAAGCGESEGRKKYNEAQALQERNEFTEAAKAYEAALPLLRKEELPELVKTSEQALLEMQLYQMSYPDLEADVEKKLAEAYPKVPQSERDEWISSGEMENMTWDGKVHYFDQAVENIATRHFEVSYLNEEKNAMMGEFGTGFIEDFVKNKPAENWQIYSNPHTWIGTESVSIPRGELPATGIFKLWFPLPVEMGPQNPVTVISITPDTYVKQPPSTSSDISLAYMEVPLEQLQGDLDITVKFQFTHYQENFNVDPANVGAYDKSGALYREYTRSQGNTYISDEIRETAKKVVGSEKNPYLQAKKLYDYILAEIKYSFMPHMTMWPHGERESVYVHRMKRGDCGAQSMYFSAMCRSLGIPARTTGGWQLMMGDFQSHFWAEFYLPNYGWLPVDPTAAGMADCTNAMTEEQKQEYKQFFFGNQDPLRCNVQLDVDEPLIPPAEQDVIMQLAIQSPVANCTAEMEEPASAVVGQYYTLHAEMISGATK
jgi:tetratricopeptide (TPR) repeat protein